VERPRHFYYIKILLFLLVLTKIVLKITLKEISGCTFMCSLGVFQGFNFLIILPIFMNICSYIVSLK
jgi:hypothetical protein